MQGEKASRMPDGGVGPGCQGGPRRDPPGAPSALRVDFARGVTNANSECAEDFETVKELPAEAKAFFEKVKDFHPDRVKNERVAMTKAIAMRRWQVARISSANSTSA
eukprot:3374243-Pyramimonas_sp.AAC.1